MNKIYFGTRDRMRWVKAPAVNTPLSSTGWSNVGNDLNGGGYSKLSATASRDYQFTWGASPAKDIYDITDYRSGAYGDGLLYYVDPFAMRTNAFPAAFSQPKSLCTIGRMGGTFTAPSGSRVEYTNLATNPGFETPGATVEVRRNRMLNPQVTPATWVPSYGTGGAGAVVYDNSGVGGAPVIKVTWSAQPTSGVPRIVANSMSLLIPVTAGETITVSCDIASSSDVCRMIVDWRSDTTWLSSSYGDWTTSVSRDIDNPTRLTFTGVVPAGATKIQIFPSMLLADAVQGAWLHAGRGMVESGSYVGDYFDGSYSPDPDLTPEWTGPVNASASRLMGRQAQRSLAAGAGTRAYQSEVWKRSGTKSICIDPRSLTTEFAEAEVANMISSRQHQLQAGKTYTVAAWLHIEQPGTGGERRARRINSYDAIVLHNYEETNGPQAPNTPGDHLVRHTFTVRADAIQAILRLGGNGTDQKAWWDDLTIVEGNVPNLMPFTGDTPASQGYKYRWTGTANASTSEKYVSADSPSYTEIPQPVGVTVTGADSPSVYVPVPPGYRLWVSYVATAPLLRTSQGTVPPTAPSATEPVWSSWSDGQDFRWDGSGTVWGAQALILPMNETPTPDHEWCVGKGNSGLRFSGEPSLTGISAVVGGESGLINGSVTLKETGLWE